MATVTKQTMAANGINGLLALMAQFRALRSAVNEYVSQYNSAGWSTIWAAMPTAPANADGSYGTADGSPNNAHPIDARVVSTLNTAMASNDLVSGVAMIEALQAFLTNAAVATANRNAVLDLFQQG